jgi:hypothetical protein
LFLQTNASRVFEAQDVDAQPAQRDSPKTIHGVGGPERYEM